MPAGAPADALLRLAGAAARRAQESERVEPFGRDVVLARPQDRRRRHSDGAHSHAEAAAALRHPLPPRGRHASDPAPRRRRSYAPPQCNLFH